jgi:prophage antirepressor-like protein
MSNITSFNFNGADVRTIVLPSGEPGFVGKDVAERLGYANPSDAIGRHCKGVVIRYPLPTAGGLQEARILTEPDVLRLIVSSSLPEAEAFERWVFEDVLPSIRRTGQYVAPKPSAEDRPISLEAEIAAAARVLSDDRLKALFPLLWQDITDGMQNALRRTLGAPLALPAPDAPKLLDVVEIAKAHGIDLPQSLRSAAGKYVKARVTAVETERLINGAIRKSSAYADHAAVAAALREYLGKRAA